MIISVFYLNFLAKPKKRRENGPNRKKRLSAKQRQRRDLYAHKNHEAFIREAEQFWKFWAPSTDIVQTECEVKSFRAESFYYEGGQDFEQGRRLWRRPCFKDIQYCAIGDSMFRILSKIILFKVVK